MGRVTEAESVAIQVMAELVTKRAEESAERCHSLLYGCSRPNPDYRGVEGVVSEQFG